MTQSVSWVGLGSKASLLVLMACSGLLRSLMCCARCVGRGLCPCACARLVPAHSRNGCVQARGVAWAVGPHVMAGWARWALLQPRTPRGI